MIQLILGSSSPRRKELLNALGYSFDIIKPDVEETYPVELSMRNVPLFIAEKKFYSLKESLLENQVLICADTVVVFENKILGKPTNNLEALDMLMNLSGNWHEVITGVVIGSLDKSYTFDVLSKVKFSNFTTFDAQKYINECNPLDKAGSYGIQEWIGYAFIECLEGSYTNIVGLPTHEVYQKLKLF